LSSYAPWVHHGEAGSWFVGLPGWSALSRSEH
jgi:hypothetical protein